MLKLLKRYFHKGTDWVLYTLLNDKNRQRISNLFSDRQKEIIKNILNGEKHNQIQKLRKIKYHLYNLGFEERAMEDLEHFFQTTEYDDLKRSAAWELALWYGNKYTIEGAKKSLQYLIDASKNENGKDQQRRIAILKAECYDLLNDQEKGKQILTEVMSKQDHVDLYLGYANLESDLSSRIKWINKGLQLYNLSPIDIKFKEESDPYRGLKTLTKAQKNSEPTHPKVSIIIPAYNAGEDIGVAIESLMTQTWSNIEIIVVDDCSTDETKNIVERYVTKDSRIKLLSTPINSGPYVARNIGLKEAVGEFVTINDSDDWSHSEKIEIQVKHLIENKDIIANTSEHARITEENFKFFRRGTPGRYVFANMSSIMFRREPIIEKMGYWDSVRFAGDGEFKRRIIRVFGSKSFEDLYTGPLSFPRQAINSLTGSSAFGYHGFFMGARKEYVESMEFFYHKGNFYYPFSQGKRPFPVPEPMWVNRETKKSGRRHFDIVVSGDFRKVEQEDIMFLKKLIKSIGNDERIGLIQINNYDLKLPKDIDSDIRRLIDGHKIQMLVYGEKINADRLVVLNLNVLEEKQKYIPDVNTDMENIAVVIREMPGGNSVKDSLENMKRYFGNVGLLYPWDDQVRKLIAETQIKEIAVSRRNWLETIKKNDEVSR